ncbi:MAG: hypothetical protein AAFZ63_27550 [Bacteroidota bacterium]
MGIIDRLKDRSYQKSLPAKPARSKGKAVRNLEEAKTIAILFDATDIDHRKRTLAYADKLRKRNKQVNALGFISTADKEATFSFNFFTLRDIDWAKRPKGEQVKQWLDKEYDVLVCLFPSTNRFTEFLALHNRAGLKIGPVTENTACYDLMLDMPKASPEKIIQQYESVLAKTMPQAV